jgi:tRNA1Val (adenine37-N6)-methyltransferase
VIPLLLSARTKAGHITGLEIQQHSADMAQRSVMLNHLEDRIEIIRGDIRETGRIFPAASFDVVTSNPPYMTSQHGLVNPESAKAIARHEICCNLDDVCAAAAGLLRSGGRFYMVHRPFRLAEIIRALSAHRLEPKRMRLVYPFADREPNMVLLESVRGGRPRISVEKPLIIYEEAGQYTEEVRSLYYN